MNPFIEHHPIPANLLMSILTGLAASAAYQFMAWMWQRRKLRVQFAQFAGAYDEFVREPTGSPTPTYVTIRLTYQSRTKFKTEAFRENDRLWHGEIFMRAEVPVLGEGFYSHDECDDTGIHSVLFNPEVKQFNVSGSNTSHPKGKKEFKTIWRRQLDHDTNNNSA